MTVTSSSVAMETIGLKRGLTKILENGIKVDVLTIDRLPSFCKIMRVDYPFILHEFKIWHVVKGRSISNFKYILFIIHITIIQFLFHKSIVCDHLFCYIQLFLFVLLLRFLIIIVTFLLNK